MRNIDAFPATLVPGEEFTFTFEGATYRARTVYTHVFHEAAALALHLGLADRAVYDGLEILPADGTPDHHS